MQGDLLQELSSDSSQHVRSALASVIMGMAPVLGKVKITCTRLLFGLWMQNTFFYGCIVVDGRFCFVEMEKNWFWMLF